LGQTAERVWLDLVGNPDGSSAREIAERIGGDPKTIRRVLDTKLVPNGLVTVEAARSGRGRPAKVYRLDPSAGRDRMDAIAESCGVLDWHERTADRYDRERAAYREIERQRWEQQRQRQSQVDADWANELVRWSAKVGLGTPDMGRPVDPFLI
jgi:predicted ArsR family transcriptional regulator